MKHITGFLLSVALLMNIAFGEDLHIQILNFKTQTEQYEKIAFAISDVPASVNPYDPALIAVDLRLISPGGKKITVPAFYYEPFEHKQMQSGRRSQDWNYPTGSGEWRARFAGAEVGTYRGYATVKTPQMETRSAEITFRIVTSEHSGFVRISSLDPRFLQLDDGSSFFPVGQNVAFIRESIDTERIFSKMGENGANYVRVWASCDDWALSLESRRSGWTRSWSKDSPIVSSPDEQDRKVIRIAQQEVVFIPTRPVALCSGTRYRLSGKTKGQSNGNLRIRIDGMRDDHSIETSPDWNRFSLDFTSTPNQHFLSRILFQTEGTGVIYLDEISLCEVNSNIEIMQEADANRPIMGVYSQIDSFMLDQVIDIAERHNLRIQLVVLSRNLYMNDLKDSSAPEYDRPIADAKKLMRYAVARWGYSTSVATWEYFNEMDPGLPTGRFYKEMAEYLDVTDPYRHLRTVSTWSLSKRDCQLDSLDMADMHWYMRPAEKELFFNAAEAVKQRSAIFLKNVKGKPALFSEFGMTSDDWRYTDGWATDTEFRHIHNGLWASALSGLSGTVLPWFWEELDSRNTYHYYKPLSEFLADIPFASGKVSVPDTTSLNGLIDIFALRTEEKAWVWVVNRESSWNKIGKGGETPPVVNDAKVTIAGIIDGNYTVEWRDTIAGSMVRKDSAKVSSGVLSLTLPPFTHDLSCKITKE